MTFDCFHLIFSLASKARLSQDNHSIKELTGEEVWNMLSMIKYGSGTLYLWWLQLQGCSLLDSLEYSKCIGTNRDLSLYFLMVDDHPWLLAYAWTEYETF